MPNIAPYGDLHNVAAVLEMRSPFCNFVILTNLFRDHVFFLTWCKEVIVRVIMNQRETVPFAVQKLFKMAADLHFCHCYRIHTKFHHTTNC